MTNDKAPIDTTRAILCFTCGAVGTAPCSLPRCGIGRRDLPIKMAEERTWVADDTPMPRGAWISRVRSGLRAVAVKWGLG